jgi:ABC-type taurine transport system substrate-binding protein
MFLKIELLEISVSWKTGSEFFSKAISLAAKSHSSFKDPHDSCSRMVSKSPFISSTHFSFLLKNLLSLTHFSEAVQFSKNPFENSAETVN